MATTSRSHSFRPVFTITPGIARDLMRIEAVKQSISALPITARMLASLRETARLFSTHYSTMIEGNRLSQHQVGLVIQGIQHFPGRERDEEEVLGYYAALDCVESLTHKSAALGATAIRTLHALVMGRGRTARKPTHWRDGENVIRDSRSGTIVYLPPEAQDVPILMRRLVEWINTEQDLPVPLKAALAHYQFATIHPYYDGNGRTARLLTTFILHSGGYGLKGLYGLEEYYARDLRAYYEALSAGPSHNYYLGRAEADITRWVAYFIRGMAASLEKVNEHARRETSAGRPDHSGILRDLDPKQRKALTLFETSREIAARDVAALFGLQPRTASALCRRWAGSGFLVMADPAKKSRRYRLAKRLENRLANLLPPSDS